MAPRHICTALQHTRMQLNIPSPFFAASHINHKVPLLAFRRSLRPLTPAPAESIVRFGSVLSPNCGLFAVSLDESAEYTHVAPHFFVPFSLSSCSRAVQRGTLGFPMHFEVFGVTILLLAAATDWADGYFAPPPAGDHARHLARPIADKLLISAAFVSWWTCTWFPLGCRHHRRP